MDKTLHRKLTEKHFYTHISPVARLESTMQPGLMQEVNMLLEAAKDLMQPRPEAVANILRLARGL